MTDLLRRFYSSGSGSGSLDPIALVKKAIPDDMPVKVTEILPRLKDGGAFVKVQYDASISPSEIECKLIVTHLHLQALLTFSFSNTSRKAGEAPPETLVQPIPRNQGSPRQGNAVA